MSKDKQVEHGKPRVGLAPKALHYDSPLKRLGCLSTYVLSGLEDPTSNFYSGSVTSTETGDAQTTTTEADPKTISEAEKKAEEYNKRRDTLLSSVKNIALDGADEARSGLELWYKLSTEGDKKPSLSSIISILDSERAKTKIQLTKSTGNVFSRGDRLPGNWAKYDEVLEGLIQNSSKDSSQIADELLKAVEKIGQSHNDLITELRKESETLKKLGSESRALKQVNEALKTQLEDGLRNLSTVTAERDTIKGENEKLKTKNKEQKERLESLNRKVFENQTELKASKDHEAELKLRNDKLEARVAHLEEQITQLSNTQASGQSKLMDTFTAALAEASERRKALESKLNETESKLDETEKELDKSMRTLHGNSFSEGDTKSGSKKKADPRASQSMFFDPKPVSGLVPRDKQTPHHKNKAPTGGLFAPTVLAAAPPKSAAPATTAATPAKAAAPTTPDFLKLETGSLPASKIETDHSAKILEFIGYMMDPEHQKVSSVRLKAVIVLARFLTSQDSVNETNPECKFVIDALKTLASQVNGYPNRPQECLTKLLDSSKSIKVDEGSLFNKLCQDLSSLAKEAPQQNFNENLDDIEFLKGLRNLLKPFCFNLQTLDPYFKNIQLNSSTSSIDTSKVNSSLSFSKNN